MDFGQLVYILGRLTLGALASFFAIMVWSRTRDPAWILAVAGTLAAYVETVYSILKLLGFIGEEGGISLGSLPLASIVLPSLPTALFAAAFVVMAVRKYRIP